MMYNIYTILNGISEEVLMSATKKPSGERTYSNFSVVIYPTEDPLHLTFLTYIKAHYDVIHIDHDKDVWEEDGDGHLKGEPKKLHTHVVWRETSKATVSSQKKYYHRWLKMEGDGAIKGVENIAHAVHYLTHDTPDSMDKFHYDSSLLVMNSTYYVKYVHKTEILFNSEKPIAILSELEQNEEFTMIRALKAFYKAGNDELDWFYKHQQLVGQFVRDQQYKRKETTYPKSLEKSFIRAFEKLMNGGE